MIQSAIIAVVSLALFCYWFRYMCHLIVAAGTPAGLAQETLLEIQLCFPEARMRLQHGTQELGRLKQMLDHDYELLTGLRKRALNAQTMKLCMLALHYRLTALMYQLSRSVSDSAARNAVEEMSNVIAYLANVQGAAVPFAA